MDFLIQLDHLLFIFINQTTASSWQDSFFPFITDLHKNQWFRVIVPLFVVGFFFHRYKTKGLLYFFLFLVSLSFSDFSGSQFFKKVVERPRPFQTEGLTAVQKSPAHGGSFISNHAANMFVFATYTSAFFPAFRFALFALAIIIAYSRVYNGVHFPLDVVCGALWGITIGLLFILLARSLGSWIDQRLQIKAGRNINPQKKEPFV